MPGVALIGTFYRIKDYAFREAEKKNKMFGKKDAFAVVEFRNGWLVIAERQLRNIKADRLNSRPTKERG